MYGRPKQDIAVSGEVLQTAFLSAKNMGTVYSEILGLLEAGGQAVGTEYVDLISEIMRRVWEASTPKQLQREHGSPKGAIIHLNKITVTSAIRIIRAAARPAVGEKPTVTQVPKPAKQPSQPSQLSNTRSSRIRPHRSVSPTPRFISGPRGDPTGRFSVINEIGKGSEVEHDQVNHDDLSQMQALPQEETHETVRETPPSSQPWQASSQTVARDRSEIRSQVSNGTTRFVVTSASRNVKLWPQQDVYSVPVNIPAFTKLVLNRVDFSPHNFTVTECNNRLHFSEDDDGMLTVTVQPGSWRVEDLAQELSSAMTSVGKYRYRVTVNGTTKIIRIEQLTPVQDSQLHLLFEQTRNNLGQILGFGTGDRRGKRSYDGDEPYRLESCDTLLIYCDELSGDKIPLVTVSSISAGDALDLTVFADDHPKTLTRMTFKMRDLHKNPFPFGGRDHALHFTAG